MTSTAIKLTALKGLLFACFFVPSWAVADVYRCTQADGKIVYQEMTCAASNGAKEEKTDWTAAREREAREDAKRKQAAALDKANELAAKAKSSNDSDGPTDCINLYRYSRARGQGWIMSSAIVEEARRTGTCIDSK